MTATNTREMILDLGERLYRSKGYAGFSYHDISKPLGIKNAAIHYHFPTKSDLGYAIIQRALEKFNQWLQSPSIQSLSPKKQLEATIEVIFSKHVENDLTVCLVGNSAVSFHLIADDMKEEVKSLASHLIGWITSILDRGIRSGDFRFEGNPEDKAVLIMSALSGAMQISRMMGRSEFSRVTDQLLKELI